MTDTPGTLDALVERGLRARASPHVAREQQHDGNAV